MVRANQRNVRISCPSIQRVTTEINDPIIGTPDAEPLADPSPSVMRDRRQNNAPTPAFWYGPGKGSEASKDTVRTCRAGEFYVVHVREGQIVLDRLHLAGQRSEEESASDLGRRYELLG